MTIRLFLALTILGTAATAQAQSPAIAAFPSLPVSAPGVTTTSRPMAVRIDSLGWCEQPAAPVKAAVRRKPVAARPKAAVASTPTPVARKSVARKAAPATPKLAEAMPRMMCPQYDAGPKMYGGMAMPAGPETVVPMGPSMVTDLMDPMAFVDGADLPAAVSPVSFAKGNSIGGRGLWFGGGAMLVGGFFSSFGGNKGGKTPPRVGMIPPTFTPTPFPPDDPHPPVTSTPEPGTMVLLGTGLTAMAGVIRRRRKQHRKQQTA